MSPEMSWRTLEMDRGTECKSHRQEYRAECPLTNRPPPTTPHVSPPFFYIEMLLLFYNCVSSPAANQDSLKREKWNTSLF